MDEQIDLKDQKFQNTKLKMRKYQRKPSLFATIESGVIILILTLLYFSGYNSLSEIQAILNQNSNLNYIIIGIAIINSILVIIFFLWPPVLARNLQKELHLNNTEYNKGFGNPIILALSFLFFAILLLYSYYKSSGFSDSILFLVVIFAIAFTMFFSSLITINKIIIKLSSES